MEHENNQFLFIELLLVYHIIFPNWGNEESNGPVIQHPRGVDIDIYITLPSGTDVMKVRQSSYGMVLTSLRVWLEKGNRGMISGLSVIHTEHLEMFI